MQWKYILVILLSYGKRFKKERMKDPHQNWKILWLTIIGFIDTFGALYTWNLTTKISSSYFQLSIPILSLLEAFPNHGRQECQCAVKLTLPSGRQ